MQNMFKNNLINQSSQILIRGCHLCWWQIKGLIVAVTMIALAGCQSATLSSSSIPAATSPTISKPDLTETLDQTRSAINRTTPDIPSYPKKPHQDDTADLAVANAIMD